MAARASKSATKDPPRRVRQSTSPAPIAKTKGEIIAKIANSPRDGDLPMSFTIQETADALRVHRLTIHRLIQRNLIRTTMVASRRFVPEDELRRLLREGTGEA